MNDGMQRRLNELSQLLCCFDREVEPVNGFTIWLFGRRIVAYGSSDEGASTVRINAGITFDQTGLWFSGETARYLLENG